MKKHVCASDVFGQRINVILNRKKVTEMDMSKWTFGNSQPGQAVESPVGYL